ncbi:MAG TPA: Crp/Fnr family transcriptional regulator [Clostridium sp.]|uniref:Crp/Fnr family transcriptional regulator n=1 Tax=Clostridium lapidicellarium TaxID=3240931 RepID=A0ABV4E083_9CLOT|nr:Crp/Fnr family transcriptional regulator [uncultured Clostridium sp.]NLU06825.1 Crp/Fnr family transcriptional regulator [Clostridiales bacterium]HBC97413.1 Crp/Fnr family transcriptional regulator [Clostridium sp.]
MVNHDKNLSSRLKDIESLYKAYPVLKKISMDNGGIIEREAVFKTIYFDEYLKLTLETCRGVLFVIKGTVKIQKINEEGDETNLYNIKKGEFCHETLSCLSKLESLKIVGRAIQDSEICVIPVKIVEKYFIKDKEFLSCVYKDLYNKFNAVIENKERIIHESLESRLVRVLLNKNSRVIYTTHAQLAFEVDSAREVVSRRLKSIEKNGYIKLQRGRIVILKDLNELLKD